MVGVTNALNLIKNSILFNVHIFCNFYLIFLCGQRGSDLSERIFSQFFGVVLSEEEVVRADLAGDGDALELGLLDDLDLVLPSHVADVNRSIVKRG